MPKPRKCKFPNCLEPGREGHHVIYKPKPCVFSLCTDHHKSITCCNINASAITRRKLSNKHRWAIWNSWLKGKLKPVFTENALDYLKSWKD